jgi:hypothetical protein
MKTDIPLWLQDELKVTPYHSFIQLSDFLARPDHVQQIEAFFGEVLRADAEMMGESEVDDQRGALHASPMQMR